MTTDRTDIHGLADRLSGFIREIRGFCFLQLRRVYPRDQRESDFLCSLRYLL